MKKASSQKLPQYDVAAWNFDQWPDVEHASDGKVLALPGYLILNPAEEIVAGDIAYVKESGAERWDLITDVGKGYKRTHQIVARKEKV